MYHRAKSINHNLLSHYHHSPKNHAKTLIHTHSHQNQKPKPNHHKRKHIPFITEIKQIDTSEQALSLFHHYNQLGYKHYYPSYAALLYKLARSKNFDAVETILTHMKNTDIQCNETVFIALFQHYGPLKAIELFRAMPKFNCVRTLQSFNALLNILVDHGMFCEANDAFERCYEMGYRPNTVTFNIMMKGWLKKGEWENACKVFDEMLERKVQPSVVSYNSLIGFLSKKGDLDKAMRLVEDMRQKGKRANGVTYALLMEGFCSLGKYEEAKKLMFDMAYRGCQPQLVNFSVLMNDLGKRGKIDEAMVLFREMRKRRLKPDVVTYNVFVNYLCKEGKTAEAYKMLVEMQIGGCEPNAATYRMLLDGLCQNGDFESGLSVLNLMFASRHFPRSDTFNCLVVGLLKSGNIDGGCFVLEEMVKRKVDFDLESWEAVIKYACSEDDKGGSMLLTTLAGEFDDVLDRSNSKSLSDSLEDIDIMYKDFTSSSALESNGLTPQEKHETLLEIDNLILKTPSDSTLITDLSLTIKANNNLLITGPSGSGKTSLLRVMAGLWRTGTGKIIYYVKGGEDAEKSISSDVNTPRDISEDRGKSISRKSGIFFLPQKPYMVLGTLRQQLLYPTWGDDVVPTLDNDKQKNVLPFLSNSDDMNSELMKPKTDELIKILEDVRLGYILPRFGLDSTHEWSSVLSLGEQQRLAFARLLLSKPQLALLDESTSALDEANEVYLYEKIAAAGITYISVGHRSTLSNFHDRILRISTTDSNNEQPNWHIEPTRRESSKV